MASVIAMLLLAQAAAPPPTPEVIRPDAPFDLATYASRASGCSDPDPTGGDIVVCARMSDLPKSLEEQAIIFEPKPFRPAWGLLGGEGGVRVEQRSTLSGSAPAIMGTFKLKF